MCKVIRDNLKAAQSRQKSYYDSKHRDLTFEIGDHVYLRVSPMKGTRRSVSKGSLPLDTWVLSRSLAKEAISPINLSFHQTLQTCTMCFMSLSSASVSRLLTAPSTLKRLISNKTYLIVSTPLLFLKKLSARLATSQSNSSKLSGHNIPTVKPPGNTRTTSVPNIQSFSSPRSRDEILS